MGFILAMVIFVPIGWFFAAWMIRNKLGWLLFLIWAAIGLLIVTGGFTAILGEP